MVSAGDAASGCGAGGFSSTGDGNVDGNDLRMRRRRERLSALVDGELDGGDVDAACGDWRGDASCAAPGTPGMRSATCCAPTIWPAIAQADLRFCAAVSARLATEAVVLAPAKLADAGHASAAPRRCGRAWAVGSAVAAGLVLVGRHVRARRSGTSPVTERVALIDGRRDRRPAAGTSTLAAGPALRRRRRSAPLVATVADQKLIRDAQLDRYLVAHKQFAGSSALGVPSAFLRSATVDSASR